MTHPIDHVIVIMGVSGSGKTIVGQTVAARLGVSFQEGDALHPAANIAKMRAGFPLDDDDRAPWLDAVAQWIERRTADRSGGVVSCSALRRAYRDRLRIAGGVGLPFILLDPPAAIVRARLEHRYRHFMPSSLLDSQLAILERPEADEHALVLTSAMTVEAQASTIQDWLAPTCER